MKDAFQSGLWGYNSMFEEENKGFIEKMKDFAWASLFTVVLCVIIGLIAYLLVGCAKKPSVETNHKKKESVEVQNLVINNDFNEPAHVVIIDKDGMLTSSILALLISQKKTVSKILL